jgi:hypothetical protein
MNVNLAGVVFVWLSILLIGYWPAILLAAWFTVKRRNTIRRKPIFIVLGSMICGLAYSLLTFVPSRLLQHFGLFKQLSWLLLVATALGLLLGFWLLKQLAKWKPFLSETGKGTNQSNQASEATSEPAPSAGSSSPQG